MSSDTFLDVREVSINASDDANVLSCVHKLNRDVINVNRGHCFLVRYQGRMTRCRKDEELCLLWS